MTTALRQRGRRRASASAPPVAALAVPVLRGQLRPDRHTALDVGRKLPASQRDELVELLACLRRGAERLSAVADRYGESI